MSDTEADVPTLREDIAKIGGWKELLGCEFYIALAFAMVTLSILLLINSENLSYSELLSAIWIAFVGVSGALLGFIIAAYALIISAGNDVFRKIFRPSTFYICLKVDFSWTAILIGACIITSLFGLTLSMLIDGFSIALLFGASMFLFVWCVMNIIVLMTDSVRVFGDLASR
ncbi:MAG: hypothetical protein LBJ20_03700 [Candidatus Methanoplasma sp.]|nr:hypothetical protein [Candidatus Methanoplasma sp.]